MFLFKYLVFLKTRKNTLFFLCLFLCLCPVLTEAAFFRDLSVGSRGADVKELQQQLNQLGFLIASSGPGSLGQETDYFGILTKNAVARFQEANKESILYPVGLSGGNGYFGPLTRQALASKIGQSGQIEQLSMVDNQLPPIFITGNYGENSSLTQKSKDKETSSNNSDGFTGIAGLPSAPKRSSTMNIHSISPASGVYGDLITIKGEGFSLTNNTVYTGNNVLYNVESPDGKTIKFVLEDTFNPTSRKISFDNMDLVEPNFDSEVFNGLRIQDSTELPLGVYVKNDTGVSNEIDFTLIIKTNEYF